MALRTPSAQLLATGLGHPAMRMGRMPPVLYTPIVAREGPEVLSLTPPRTRGEKSLEPVSSGHQNLVCCRCE